MTTVKEILISALKEMGADGLCNPGECGCGIDDLMPCFDGSCSICVPAKRVPVPEEAKDECDEWYDPMTDEEIAANREHNHHCHCMPGECNGSHGMGSERVNVSESTNYHVNILEDEER